MHLSEEQLNSVEEMAYRLFSPDMIAINIEVDEEDFNQAIETPGSNERKRFYKGLIRHESELRESIMKSARNGSNPAQEQLLKMIKGLKIQI